MHTHRHLRDRHTSKWVYLGIYLSDNILKHMSNSIDTAISRGISSLRGNWYSILWGLSFGLEASQFFPEFHHVRRSGCTLRLIVIGNLGVFEVDTWWRCKVHLLLIIAVRRRRAVEILLSRTVRSWDICCSALHHERHLLVSQCQVRNLGRDQ